MKQYLELIKDIIENGECISPELERTGAGTKSVFGRMIRFDISEGRMPLVTTRKIRFDHVFYETMFFLKGMTDVTWLRERGVNFWDDWASTEDSFRDLMKDFFEKGYLPGPHDLDFHINSALMNPDGPPPMNSIGPMYGNLWRYWPLASTLLSKLELDRLKLEDIPADVLENIKNHFAAFEIPKEELETKYKCAYLSTVDQIGMLIKNLKEDPYSRRHVVTAFNPSLGSIPGIHPNQQAFLGKGALYPCHIMFQVNVRPPRSENGKKRLSLKLTMRSWDICLGGPYNIAGYAFLAHALAREVGMETDELIIDIGDCHVYLNQIDKAREQIQREPREVPRIIFLKTPEEVPIFQLEYSDIEIQGYDPHPAINYARNV